MLRVLSQFERKPKEQRVAVTQAAGSTQKLRSRQVMITEKHYHLFLVLSVVPLRE
jgi:hypothetical protein